MESSIKESLQKSMSYHSFKELVSTLLAEGKSTGTQQTETLLNYSLLSDRRMKRLDKTLKLATETKEKLQENTKDLLFLVLMESWCGDGAQTLPILHKMAEENNSIELKIALRDENDDLMQKFLTNGGKAIPKLIVIDKNNLEVLANWGPRPSVATKMVNEYKTQHGKLDASFKKDLQVWYNKDKGKSTEKDILDMLQRINKIVKVV